MTVSPSSTELPAYLARDYDLRMLRVSMQDVAGARVAAFQLTLGNEQPPDAVPMLYATMQELGLPPTGTAAARGRLRESFALPTHITEALRPALNAGARAGQPLWLSLAAPTGLLAALPWEALLQPALRVPILRLPYQSICPRLPSSDLDTVLCIGIPLGSEQLPFLVEAMLSQVRRATLKRMRIHVFAKDSLPDASLSAFRSAYGSDLVIETYATPDPNAPDATEATHAWLGWMRRAFAARHPDRAVDVVHVVCHGYQQYDEGMMALADLAPDTGGTAAWPMVSAAELVQFLNELGAWGLVIASPPSNPCPAGLRLLQHALARLRPGPSAMCEADGMGPGEPIGKVYEFLFDPAHPVPTGAGLSLYCHPVLVSGREYDAASKDQLDQFTIVNKLQDVYRELTMPVWVASLQRQLEMAAGSMLSTTGTGSPPEQGATAEVLDAVTDYVKRANKSGGPS